jgi:hypothetical protein
VLVRGNLAKTIPFLSNFIKRMLKIPKDRPNFFRQSDQSSPFVILYKDVTKLAKKIEKLQIEGDVVEEYNEHVFGTCFSLVLKELVRRDDISHENLSNIAGKLRRVISKVKLHL